MLKNNKLRELAAPRVKNQQDILPYGFRTADAGRSIFGRQFVLKKKMLNRMQIIKQMGTFNTQCRTDEEKNVKISKFGQILLEG